MAVFSANFFKIADNYVGTDSKTIVKIWLKNKRVI